MNVKKLVMMFIYLRFISRYISIQICMNLLIHHNIIMTSYMTSLRVFTPVYYVRLFIAYFTPKVIYLRVILKFVPVT
jgi:hypothetical protein